MSSLIEQIDALKRENVQLRAQLAACARQNKTVPSVITAANTVVYCWNSVPHNFHLALTSLDEALKVYHSGHDNS